LKRTLSLAATACLMALVARSVTAADFALDAEAYDSGDYAAAYGEWITLARDGHAGAQIAIAICTARVKAAAPIRRKPPAGIGLRRGRVTW